MSTGNTNAHETKAFLNAQAQSARNQANQFGERNFLGAHRHNKGGVAKGGALQAKRYGGTFTLSTIVGN